MALVASSLTDSAKKTAYLSGESNVGGCSERMKMIKRRRHRRQKIAKFKQRVEKASVSEKQRIAQKLRALSPGAEQLIEHLSLAER